MDFLIVIAIQFLLMTVGYLITVVIGVKNKLESLGLSYLFGSGVITIIFLLNHFLFAIPLNSSNFLIAILFSISTLLLTIYYRNQQHQILNISFSNIKKTIKQYNCFEKFILLFLLLIIAYTLLENYFWPITDWDSLALYDFRAKVIALKGNMLEGIKLGYFFQYPPYTSFLHVFGYVFGIKQVKVVYSFIYISLLIVFYSLLKRKQKNWIALLGTLLLSLDTFIFRHATTAYTNLPYTVFLSLGLIYLSFWLTSKNRKELIIGSILVGLSTWVRTSDPFWYIGIIAIIFGTIKNKENIKRSVSLIFISFGIQKLWTVFVQTININSSSTLKKENKYLEAIFNSSGILSILQTLPEIIIYYWDNVISVILYLLPVLFLVSINDLRKKNYANKYLYIFLIVALVFIFVGIIIFSLFYETWNLIGDSLQRMSMVLIPIISFLIFNSNIWKENIFEKK